jgi:membrane protein DedA with SNARE-associated domain
MFLGIDIANLMAAYGYWAVLLLVTAESMGLPVPGETMLLSAAIYASISGHLSIGMVILAAAAGAILGDNIGYVIGRLVGSRLEARFGVEGRSGRALLVGRYVFRKHGGKAVFFGRFVAVLRVFAAFLAGATRMSWPRFALFNASGGVIWAVVMGSLGYGLGASVTGPLGIAGMVGGALVMAALTLLVRRHGQRWEREALTLVPEATYEMAA